MEIKYSTIHITVTTCNGNKLSFKKITQFIIESISNYALRSYEISSLLSNIHI